jgi:transcriptional adapter 2-beta
MSLEEQRALGYMPLRDDFEREYKNDSEILISNLAVANNQLAFLCTRPNESLSTAAQPTAPPTSPSADVEVNEDQIDFELKLSLIDMYRECLQERARFKKIAREYGLINNASALINNYNKFVQGLTNTLNLSESVRDGRRRNYSTINDKEMM